MRFHQSTISLYAPIKLGLHSNMPLVNNLIRLHVLVLKSNKFNYATKFTITYYITSHYNIYSPNCNSLEGLRRGGNILARELAQQLHVIASNGCTLIGIDCKPCCKYLVAYLQYSFVINIYAKFLRTDS